MPRGPFSAKHGAELGEVGSCCLPNGEHLISKPFHAEIAQFILKEFRAELSCQNGDMLNDRQTNSPLVVLRQIFDGGKQRLRQYVDADGL